MTYTKDDIVLSSTEPADKSRGMIWVDTSGNNTEWQQWNGSAWEAWLARGPDTPEYPVEGAIWRDTGAGQLKEYDGTAWVVVGRNLAMESGNFTTSDGASGTQSITFNNTYNPNLIVWGVSSVIDNTSDNYDVYAHFAGYTTDVDGNVTGMDVGYNNHGIGAGSTVYWNVLGEVV